MKRITGLFIGAALAVSCGSSDESMVAPIEGRVVDYEINGDLALRTGSVVVWHAIGQSDGSLMRVDYVFADGEGGSVASGLDFKSKIWCDDTTERKLSGFGIIAIDFNDTSTTIRMDSSAGILSTDEDTSSAICNDGVLSVGE